MGEAEGKHGGRAGVPPTAVDGAPPEGPRLAEKLQSLPERPGVYLMKNGAGEVIYVGKAVSLKHRVRSYFHAPQNLSSKVRAMMTHVADLETIVTANEIEALILECNLIKEKEPWYNIRLKDDKNYPYLKVTTEKFPRVLVVRRVVKDGARYFGPFTNAQAVRETMKFLRKLFPIRTCSLDLSGELNFRPCLLYHIGRCGAPCAALQDETAYNQLIDEVSLFLEGRQERLIPDVRRKMEEASAHLEFERAARLRNQLRALEQVVSKQKVISTEQEDQDVIGLARERDAACVQIFFVRGGKLVGREHFFLETGDVEDAEVVQAFVEQYYSGATSLPAEVVVPVPLEEADVIARWLTERRGRRVQLIAPQRGRKRQLVLMVTENAALVLQERLAAAERKQQEIDRGLGELQAELGLPAPPRRIEAFDISNLQGIEAVASMVVMEDGRPNPVEYRRFKIRLTEGPNDFAMMQEVVRRRFERGLREREEMAALPAGERAEREVKAKFIRFPDLILIDGGKGQLGAARDVLRDLGLEEIPTIGLAKQFEEIFIEDDPEPIRLQRHSKALHLVQVIRDEAHRFAITYHRQLRDKRTSQSALDTIPGVGPKRKKALLQHFGSLRRLREATLDELQSVAGIPADVAARIFQELPRGAG